MNQFGIYIHIPFCKKKCKYCDFISFFGSEEKIQKYFDKLIKEIKNSKYKNRTVTTIYIGGGTPSFVNSKYIALVLKTIFKEFNVLEDAEITIEINPGTVTKEKLEEYKKIGRKVLIMLFDCNKNEFINNLKIKPKNIYIKEDSHGDIVLYGQKFKKIG